MLYISRFVGAEKFGVVDTDDDVEEILNITQLKEAVLKSGIDINGVTVGLFNGDPWIARIEVYQAPSSVIRQQTKSKVLLGVDVKVFNNIITSIEWTASPTGEERVIRLSDYGTHIGARVFNQMVLAYSKNFCSPPLLRFILDDKLTCDSKAFKAVSNLDVKFDLREVKDDRIAAIFYTNYITRYLNDNNLFYRVSDIPKRFDFWFGIKVCNHGLAYDPGGNDLSWYVSDVKAVREAIRKKYNREFLALPKKYTFDLLEDDEYHSVKRDVCGQLKMYIAERPDILASQDFELLWKIWDFNDEIYPLANALLHKIKSPYATQARRFINYLTYFEQPDDLKSAFVAFFHRILDRIFELSVQRGWLSEEMIKCYTSVGTSAQANMG